MATYKVRIQRAIYASKDIIVEADNALLAQQMALDAAREGGDFVHGDTEFHACVEDENDI